MSAHVKGKDLSTSCQRKSPSPFLILETCYNATIVFTLPPNTKMFIPLDGLKK